MAPMSIMWFYNLEMGLSSPFTVADRDSASLVILSVITELLKAELGFLTPNPICLSQIPVDLGLEDNKSWPLYPET